MSALFALAGIALLVIAAYCFRISGWHQREADYWYDVAFQVRLDVSLDVTYRPALEWAQANRPSLLARMRSWQSPVDRRALAADR